jgi:hypothetical protein
MSRFSRAEQFLSRREQWHAVDRQALLSRWIGGEVSTQCKVDRDSDLCTDDSDDSDDAGGSTSRDSTGAKGKAAKGDRATNAQNRKTRSNSKNGAASKSPSPQTTKSDQSKQASQLPEEIFNDFVPTLFDTPYVQDMCRDLVDKLEKSAYVESLAGHSDEMEKLLELQSRKELDIERLQDQKARLEAQLRIHKRQLSFADEHKTTLLEEKNRLERCVMNQVAEIERLRSTVVQQEEQISSLQLDMLDDDLMIEREERPLSTNSRKRKYEPPSTYALNLGWQGYAPAKKRTRNRRKRDSSTEVHLGFGISEADAYDEDPDDADTEPSFEMVPKQPSSSQWWRAIRPITPVSSDDYNQYDSSSTSYEPTFINDDVRPADRYLGHGTPPPPFHRSGGLELAYPSPPTPPADADVEELFRYQYARECMKFADEWAEHFHLDRPSDKPYFYMAEDQQDFDANLKSHMLQWEAVYRAKMAGYEKGQAPMTSKLCWTDSDGGWSRRISGH